MQTAMEKAVAAAAAAVTAVAAAAGSDGRKEGTDPKKIHQKTKGAFFFNRNPPLFKINSLLSVFIIHHAEEYICFDDDDLIVELKKNLSKQKGEYVFYISTIIVSK
jgi:hypothetical protein